MTVYTPRIDPQTITNLRVIAKLYAEDPSYFDQTEYPAIVREVVRDLVHKPQATSNKEGSELLPRSTLDDSELDILTELKKTYKDLELAKPGAAEKASDLMSYFRTKTGLLEKMLEQIVQAEDRNKLSDFYQETLRIMEDHMDADKRAQVLQQLRTIAAR